ncbi:hypothetical protein M595_0898 [Lyngbya aestuarii BL J]|uniref:Uncharacterized protein n=1 Tax=Lyngbya aestuarii BL J TaxID=1348334 RepID=U7QMQ7_9CYAN|nr:hypothetical protein M595_0898 [Lyngbya aestuarii BL J]
MQSFILLYYLDGGNLSSRVEWRDHPKSSGKVRFQGVETFIRIAWSKTG